MKYIIKASGEKEKFDKNKIFNTILKAGASKKFSREIVNKVEKKVYNGIKSREILEMALGLLKSKPEIASRYNLKQAIMNLGPSGFPFEEFFSQVLQNYGYKTEVGKIIKGKNVNHEIDIIAKKKSIHMIECKYHNYTGIYTKLKVALYTHSRFLDVKTNPKSEFDFAWLATNTKCSLDAINYAKGVSMKITGWQYPENESLQKLINDKGLYPITILSSVKGFVKRRLSDSKIMLAKSLVENNLEELKKRTRLPENTLNKIIEEAREVCGC